MTSPLPVSAVLSWWGTAWLRGHAAPDDVLDAVLGEDATHAVAGLPGEDRTLTLMGGLAALRAAGAASLGLALPVAGDPLGLGGPPELTTAAVEAGEAVLATGSGLALVPARVGASVGWQVHPAAPRTVPDVGEADRDLRRGLLDAANTLASLDVARWRPEVADELADLRRPTPLAAPPGVPARCLDLAGRGVQALTVVGLALADDGAAVTAADAAARRAALLPLERAGRRALVAACSPEVWPG